MKNMACAPFKTMEPKESNLQVDFATSARFDCPGAFGAEPTRPTYLWRSTLARAPRVAATPSQLIIRRVRLHSYRHKGAVLFAIFYEPDLFAIFCEPIVAQEFFHALRGLHQSH